MLHVNDPGFKGVDDTAPDAFWQGEDRKWFLFFFSLVGGFKVFGFAVHPFRAQSRKFFVDGEEEEVLDDDWENVPNCDENCGPGVAQEVKDDSCDGRGDKKAEEIDRPEHGVHFGQLVIVVVGDDDNPICLDGNLNV